MRYASVCDGIGAAHVAFQSLGWTCAWHAEIEPFPAAVVADRWGERAGPNLGDMTKITDEEIARHGPIDALVGGTPCQSFSVAGLRGGMADDRGNLALVFLQLARRTRAEWLLWENVPGVLSSSGGRDFGAVLGGMVELGYGFAYRVLDAQYFGLAQRRKRVFVVARLGDWRAPAAVLLERESLRGNSPPSREAGEDAAGTLAARASAGGGLGTDFDLGGGLQSCPRPEGPAEQESA
jgi:DNA (cytosine-5)-methyltransferase 1